MAKQWVCTVCNYVYEGEIPFEELPDDYVCPLCGVGKSYFELREVDQTKFFKKSSCHDAKNMVKNKSI